MGPNVPVDVFSEDEALMFLASRTGLADKAAAATVAAELGYLPLALAQAAAVMARQRLGYQTYLDRLRTLPSPVPDLIDARWRRPRAGDRGSDPRHHRLGPQNWDPAPSSGRTAESHSNPNRPRRTSWETETQL